MSITIVSAIDNVLELEIDCAAEPPIASSPSLSVSIGVVEAPDCPAVPVGGGPGGDCGIVADDGLGVDCGCPALVEAFNFGCCGELSPIVEAAVLAPVPTVAAGCVTHYIVVIGVDCSCRRSACHCHKLASCC
eukprot:325326-Amphidinium_carterae.1